MSLVRRVARPLMAASFVAAGVDALLHPMPQVESVRPLVDRLAPALGLPAEAEVAVRVNGALAAGAGILYALGRAPRLSALMLATTTLPAAYADGVFWREKDPQLRRDRRTDLLRTAGMLGSALLAATADRPRRPRHPRTPPPTPTPR